MMLASENDDVCSKILRCLFEPAISPGERPKTYAFNRAVTGTGKSVDLVTTCTELLD